MTNLEDRSRWIKTAGKYAEDNAALRQQLKELRELTVELIKSLHEQSKSEALATEQRLDRYLISYQRILNER